MTGAKREAGQPQGLTDQASATVQDAAAAAQDKASELREQGSARLREQFDQRSSRAGAQVRSLAEALRRSGSDLRNEGNANVAELIGPATDRIERLGSYLEQKRGDELVREIETFARRRPWMLAGLGMVAGLAAARFMNASSEHRYSDYRRTQSQRWPSRSGAHHGGGVYGQGSGGYRAEPEGVGADIPSALSDDPPAREPYVGTR